MAKKSRKKAKKKPAQKRGRKGAKSGAKKGAKKLVGKPGPKGEKLDLYRERPEFFKATSEPGLVTLSPALYLAIEGKGAPGSVGFQDGIGALYGVAYTLKFSKKIDEGRDFKVMTLEAFWWAGSGGCDFMSVPRDEWCWKLIIMQPDFVTEADVEKAKRQLVEKKGDAVYERVSLESIAEGRCVQMLHVGPYADEPASIAKMHALMEEHGLAPRGHHHEVYMSDPRRAAPEKLRTILRQPVT